MIKALILTSILVPSYLWAGTPDQRVAYDDAGNDAKQPHLITGSNRMSDRELAAELHRLTPAPLVPVPTDPALALSLNGEWRFNPNPPAGFWSLSAAATQAWKPIQVPGEWSLQGFSVKPNVYAAYRHTLQLPAGWAGRRVILRFDAVHSACRLYLNGKAVGEHVGAFLPFEFDLTSFLLPGENRIDLAVCNDSIADTMAKGNHYAQHPIGGILRKVRIFSLPQVHAAALDLRTDLAPDFRDGSINLVLSIVNQSNTQAAATVSARLVPVGILGISLDPAASVPVDLGTTTLPALAAGAATPAEFSAKLPNPRLWHAESPFLYRVEVTLTVNGMPVETLVKTCGFRRVEIKDRRLVINGRIAKLKGVCRHSVHPTLGRALTPELIRRDAELFKAANCNLIRTSHYPAEEEFNDLCDQLGLFVMDEAPFCWVNLPRKVTPAETDFIQQTHLALQARDRHHPSVIIWSLANESQWSPVFETSARLIKHADPTRLAFFSHSEYYGTKGIGLLDLGTRHYPSWHSLLASSQYFRPIIYDEWAHLNAYNEREILTDPAIRDLWGEPVDQMWQKIVNSRNSAGVAIWGGIDEKFFVGDKPAGYGPWGIIDGWRREKPEYWHTKKTFSPVGFPAADLYISGSHIAVPVVNRYETVGFSHLRFQWSCGADHGEMRSAIPPQTAGVLEIDLTKPPAPNAELLISVVDPRGILVDRHLVTLNPAPAATREAPGNGSLTCVPTTDGWLVTTPHTRISVSRPTGLFSVNATDGKPLVERAPHLMILPSDNSKVRVVEGIPIPLEGHENDGSTLFSPVCSKWQAASVTLVAQSPQRAEFLVKGQYAEAEGEFTYTFTPDGCRVECFFNPKVNVNPRQVGIVFDLPGRFQTLTWKRKGYWSWYPENHIGRLQGTAVALPRPMLSDLNGPRQAPNWNWLDDTVIFGSNDFRSTKHNIYHADLTDAEHHIVRINSDGTQHTRCWLEKDLTRLLVATHSTQGAESYFSFMSDRDRISYGPSEFREERIICNSVNLQFNP